MKLSKHRAWRLTVIILLAPGCTSNGSDSTTDDDERAERAITSKPILGGAVDDGDPAVVAFYASQDGTSLTSTCTGSLIAPTVVLTAAHCMNKIALEYEPRGFFVVTGRNGLNANAKDIHAVAGTMPHPAYDPNSGENDIAIVRLKEPLPFTPLIVNRASIDAKNGSTARIVGFGQTRNGDSKSANTKHAATIKISQIDARHFLVGDTQTTQCHGDSGGPVLLAMNGETRIVGISWRTVANGDCHTGSRATRVDSFAAFLDGALGATPDKGCVDPPPIPPANDCGVTINCNNGSCSCGSGPNAGRACNKDSGECSTLCRDCD